MGFGLQFWGTEGEKEGGGANLVSVSFGAHQARNIERNHSDQPGM